MDTAIDKIHELYFMSSNSFVIPFSFPKNNGKAILPTMIKSLGVYGGIHIENEINSKTKGVYQLYDLEHDELLASFNMEGLTRIKKAATAALAADAMALKEAKSICILGLNALSKEYLEAFCCIRDLQVLYIWDSDYEKVENFVSDSRELSIEIITHMDPKNAIENSDIICCLSTVNVPEINANHLKKNVHISINNDSGNLLSSEIVRNSTVVVDSYDAANDMGILSNLAGSLKIDALNLVYSDLATFLLNDFVVLNQSLFYAFGSGIEELMLAHYCWEKQMLSY